MVLLLLSPKHFLEMLKSRSACSIVHLSEDVGEVEALQCLVVSEGRSQTGLQGPLHVHILAHMDEGSESGHTSSISFLIPGQIICYELNIFKSEAYKKNF